jgi:aminoglycoside phosphotransferase (APT) family kinase protein
MSVLPRAQTPIAEADLAAVLAAAFPAGVRAAVRVSKSFGYPSFRVTTGEGEFLLKIAPTAPEVARFRTTADMSALARAGGVPTPEVVSVGRAGAHPYLVQAYLPGQDVEDALPSLDVRDRERLWQDFGRAVARLHAVTGPAFSEARVLAGTEADWAAHVAVRVARLHKENVRAAVLSRAETDLAAERLVAWSRETAPRIAPALVHRDLCLRNVLVHPGRFTALLDLEHARFSDPVFDFVALAAHVFTPHPGSEAGFLAGYREVLAFPPPAYERRHAVAFGLEFFGGLVYWARAGTPAQLAAYAERVRAWLLAE